MPKSFLNAFALGAALFVLSVPVWPQSAIQAIPDNISTNVGDEVRLRIVSPSAQKSLPSLDLFATLRYAGESQPLLDQIPLKLTETSPGQPLTSHVAMLWKVPLNARTGRYEVDLMARDPRTRETVFFQRRAASFAVHRKLVRVELVELDRTSYTSGDRVACSATLKNLTDHALTGLRVEFSDRYWPWIAPTSESAIPTILPLAEGLTLAARAEQELPSKNCGLAPEMKQPGTEQYAVVVWDHERKNIYDIAFSGPVFVYPPGVDSPKPYPSHYVYPDLGSVDVWSYRKFYPVSDLPTAIQFDRDRTMFASGSEGVVGFSVVNPTSQAWRGVSVHARLVAPNGQEISSYAVAEKVQLTPGAPPRREEAKFVFPAHARGVYRAEVELRNSSGQILAGSRLELGVNPLPKSILIFCAHEDDETAHAGTIRAAVENRVPIHLVYFTSGDAGSCDVYHQRSCGPAEALNFGTLRMEETRASLAHLGVPREKSYFLGLPDGGSGQIWFKHLEPANPYLSVLLASDHAPYEALARPNLPYARKPVVEAAKEFIKKFQPEVIITGHPDERHVDHRTNNWFVVKALQELLREGALSPNLTLLVDQVYGPVPEKRAPYRYEKHVLHVSGEVSARAEEAWWFYQSQGGNRRQGQVKTFDQLPREEIHWKVVDWKDHEGWNEKD